MLAPIAAILPLNRTAWFSTKSEPPVELPEVPLIPLGGFAAKSASEMPVRAMNKPTRTRRLKKAAREVDFFFTSGAGYSAGSISLRDCRVENKKTESRRLRYWETIAEKLSKSGWSLGWVSAVDSEGRTIWIVDAHRSDTKRFVVRAEEKLTTLVELESVISGLR
jgi:hypothetical protein